MTSDNTPTPQQLRGCLREMRPNARSIAALTSNPACQRRRIMDIAQVSANDLARRLDSAPQYGQSPFAIATGQHFENQLKRGSDHALLIDALRPLFNWDEGFSPAKTDLNRLQGHSVGHDLIKARAQATNDLIRALLSGESPAPHLIDHPVLTLEVMGTTAYLEPDALVFGSETGFELIEVKSFAVIDDQADPDKLTAAAKQVAVYGLALEQIMLQLQENDKLLESSFVLVAPKNFGRQPTAHRLPLARRIKSLKRSLRRLGSVRELMSGLPVDFTFDTPSKLELESRINQLPILYVPSCMEACDMALYCRNEVICSGDPSRLGTAARDALIGVKSIEEALRIAQSSSQEDRGDVPADVAETLRDAWASIERARVGLSPIDTEWMREMRTVEFNDGGEG